MQRTKLVSFDVVKFSHSLTQCALQILNNGADDPIFVTKMNVFIKHSYYDYATAKAPD